METDYILISDGESEVMMDASSFAGSLEITWPSGDSESESGSGSNASALDQGERVKHSG